GCRFQRELWCCLKIPSSLRLVRLDLLSSTLRITAVVVGFPLAASPESPLGPNLSPPVPAIHRASFTPLPGEGFTLCEATSYPAYSMLGLQAKCPHITHVSSVHSTNACEVDSGYEILNQRELKV